MTRSKKEDQLKQNERYPLRSLSSSEKQLFEHEEELARRREQTKRKEGKKED